MINFERLFEARSATAAVNRALFGRDGDDAWIRQNFSVLVENVQVDAYAEYLTAQEIAGS
jgi:hypothetical protein